MEEICKKSNRKTVRTAGTWCEIKGTLEAIQVDTEGNQGAFMCVCAVFVIIIMNEEVLGILVPSLLSTWFNVK